MPRAVQFDQNGGIEVLHLAEVAIPGPGTATSWSASAPPGSIRARARSAPD